MRKYIILLASVYFGYFSSFGQNTAKNSSDSKTKIGIKAGYTWSYPTADQTGVTLNSRSGYMFGVFLARPSRGVIGYRPEIVYSRQGYSYDEGGKNTAILNDYIYLPQLTTFSIGKFFQLQVGGQVGFLINAKKQASNSDSAMLDLMNRVDYGFAGGIELNPVSGLILGARYNLGLGKMYKQEPSSSGIPFPLPFNPGTTNFKNGMIHIFIGFKF
jgi:hypothetical protein